MADKIALIIAVENYQDTSIDPVDHAAHDAAELSKAIEAHGFDTKHQTVLIDGKATKTAVESKLRRCLSSLAADDQFLFFYAGHGFAENDENFITCHDTQRGDLVATSITLQSLFQQVRASKSKKSLIFLDSCHSGTPLEKGMRGIYSVLSESELEDFFQKAEHAVGFASCKTNEESFSSSRLKHGIWTYHLLEALRGDAPQALEANRHLTCSSLQNYLALSVPQTLRTERAGRSVQTPVSFGNLTRDARIADLGPLLAARQAAVQPINQQILQMCFQGNEVLRVKSLSGFRPHHKVPKDVNSATQRFAQQCADEEIHERVEEVAKSLRTHLAYKREDFRTDYSQGSGSLIGKDFDYAVQVSLKEDDPQSVEFQHVVLNIRNPRAILSDEFQAAFPDTFDRLELDFAQPVPVKKIIDTIEALPKATAQVDYPGDCSFCTITSAALPGTLHVGARSVTLEFPSYLPPRKMIDGFRASQGVLTGKLGVLALPFRKTP